MKVADVMTREVITISPEQTLEEAARMLVETGVSGIPVVEDEKVVGMLSERDLLEARSEPRPPRYLELLGGIIYLDSTREFSRQLEKMTATSVAQLMSRDVVSLSPDNSLDEAAKIIIDRGINRVPVVDGEKKLVGIITRTDVLRGIMKAD
ncbi:MAG: CBS domain-containing protein [Firmicutes bacterium]|nr:CBS domain-containing protein [Bacillota bacterium]